MQTKTVRFIPFAYYSPYENMAIDEFLISYYEKTKIPVLRLYSWRPAGISAGKNQDVNLDIDIAACKAAGIPVVRRLTGGGAIFHKNELTYSIACSDTDFIGKKAGVKESFENLNAFILKMYFKFGLEASYGKDAFPGEKSLGARQGFCFAGNEEYDIIIKGKKTGGNAQYRRREIIFQHGSIPLDENEDAQKYFKCPVNRDNFTSLDRLLGREVTAGEVAANLGAAFMETFGCDLKEETLSMDEKRGAIGIMTSKYATDNWNLKKI